MRGLGANVKTQYAVQTVIYLARRERGAVVPVSEIATAVSVSPKLLEDVLAALRTAGIVQSRRGKVGGYQLVPAPPDLSVMEVVRALEGPVDIRGDERDGAIARAAAQAFDQAQGAAAELLAHLSIEELAERSRRLEVERAAIYMYHL